MTTVSIHQPQYIPWLPYFDKIDQSDVFVFLDSVQYQKNGLQNRNQIKTKQGAHWLTIPVHATLDHTISETQIVGNRWVKKHLKTIQMNYARADHFDLFEEFSEILKRDWQSLADVTIAVTEWMMTQLHIDTRVVRSSQLQAQGDAQALVINICKELGADVYLSGTGAKSYQDATAFADENIDLVYQSYTNQPYQQCFMDETGFIGDLSALDLILNIGAESGTILRQGQR